jgi:hypothetical protein
VKDDIIEFVHYPKNGEEVEVTVIWLQSIHLFKR